MKSSATRFARWLGSGCLLALAACSTLPQVAPEPAAPSATPAQVENARGPLSPARSDAVLQELERGTEDTNIFNRHLALEQAVTGTPLVTGNRVLLLEDGPDTYRAMFAVILAARDHINLETYILEDDEVGRRFADALIEKQRQGVQVNLIHDSVGTLGTPTEFFQRLRDSGIRTLEYNPVNPASASAGWQLNQRDHRKLLIVDGRTAFLGGINISSVYSAGSFRPHSRTRPNGEQPWRDTDLQVEGPVVAEFQKLFLETWQGQNGEPLERRDFYPELAPQGREVVRAIGSSPDDAFSLIYVTLLSAIASAETDVLITNAYFVPDPQLLAALKAAAARGVDVRLVVPGKTDSALVFHAGRSYYDELLTDGVQIFERRDALMHSKTAVIDGVWSTVGSTNLDWRSFLHNRELNAVVLGTEFGDRLRAAFERDVRQSDRITLEQWRRRSVLDRAKEAFARLWQYWL
ncbi:MAG TPA: cardiolipin synthase [Steroidobacteraceae bacterium]|nr:cardiolipin synthase [Steroidobacteraceae bacterium]